ncbi:dehydrogenase, partial [Mesorhizobium sp. M7A.T.Ca.TU.009.01.1.1]
MKAVLCRSPGDLVLEDRPAPEAPPPGWALVAVSRV